MAGIRVTACVRARNGCSPFAQEGAPLAPPLPPCSAPSPLRAAPRFQGAGRFRGLWGPWEGETRSRCALLRRVACAAPPPFVMPAQAGILLRDALIKPPGIPAFAGMTGWVQ